MSGKVLIVDDSEIVLEAARLNLEEAGFEVITLSAPLELPYVIRRERPDMVLLDVKMPGLSGDRVVKISQQHDVFHGTPVYLFSDRSEEELQKLVAASGATGYIGKSLDADGFRRAIASFVEAARAQRGREPMAP